MNIPRAYFYQDVTVRVDISCVTCYVLRPAFSNDKVNTSLLGHILAGNASKYCCRSDIYFADKILNLTWSWGKTIA